MRKLSFFEKIRHIVTIFVLLCPSFAFAYYFVVEGKKNGWIFALSIAITAIIVTLIYLYSNIKDLKSKDLADEYENLLNKGYNEKKINEIMNKKFGDRAQ